MRLKLKTVKLAHEYECLFGIGLLITIEGFFFFCPTWIQWRSNLRYILIYMQYLIGHNIKRSLTNLWTPQTCDLHICKRPAPYNKHKRYFLHHMVELSSSRKNINYRKVLYADMWTNFNYMISITFPFFQYINLNSNSTTELQLM